ncbi:hypothetical protein VPHF86_0111 [Vibrio phage F86]
MQEQEYFDKQLVRGGIFEDAVVPLLSNMFRARDEHNNVPQEQFSTIINTATSKTDSEHGRGQRLMYCTDNSCSYMLPDVFIFAQGKQYAVEIKVKKRFYRHTDGYLYGVIDSYKIEDYDGAVRLMGFNSLLYVFGAETEDNNVYLGQPSQAREIVIHDFRDKKNPKGLFHAWRINDMQTIGKW